MFVGCSKSLRLVLLQPRCRVHANHALFLHSMRIGLAVLIRPKGHQPMTCHCWLFSNQLGCDACTNHLMQPSARASMFWASHGIQLLIHRCHLHLLIPLLLKNKRSIRLCLAERSVRQNEPKLIRWNKWEITDDYVKEGVSTRPPHNNNNNKRWNHVCWCPMPMGMNENCNLESKKPEEAVDEAWRNRQSKLAMSFNLVEADL